jgi:hypothetical protein
MPKLQPTLEGAGAFLGGGQWHCPGPQRVIECHAGWGTERPIAAGNVRLVQIATLDGALPPLTIGDGENDYVLSDARVVGGLPPGGVAVIYRATIAVARVALHGQAPPVRIVFSTPAESPTVTLYEFAP